METGHGVLGGLRCHVIAKCTLQSETKAVFNIRIMRENVPGSRIISRHHVRYRENSRFSAHIFPTGENAPSRVAGIFSLEMDRVVQTVMINKGSAKT